MADSAKYQQLSVDELEKRIIMYIPLVAHPDPAKRKEAENILSELSLNSYYLYILSKLYTTDTKKNIIAGIILRNSLMATDPTLRKRIEERYVNSANKDAIKNNLLQMCDDISIDCVSRIASLELINNQWIDYFKICSSQSLVLTVLYLKDYDFNFTSYLDTIYDRLHSNLEQFTKIASIFQGNLSTEKIDYILHMYMNSSDIAGLTVIFDIFFSEIKDKEKYIAFVDNFCVTEPFNVVKFYEMLDIHDFPFSEKILFPYLSDSANTQIIGPVSDILCSFYDKVFLDQQDGYSVLCGRCTNDVEVFLRDNYAKNSFIIMLGCCPHAFKLAYLDLLIQHSAFWSLSRILKQRFDELAVNLPQIVKCCLVAIDKNVDEEACQLLQIMLQQVSGDQYENELTFCFIDILNTLILTSERISYTEYEKRASIFGALIELVKSCADSQKVGLEKLLYYLVSKIKESLRIVDSLNMNEFLILEDILTYYLGLVEEILKKQKEQGYIETVYDVYYDILSFKRVSTLIGDVYISLSVLIAENSFFLGKMDEIVQFIVRDIKYRPGYDIFTFKAALLLIGDIAQVLSKGILKYSFLTELILNNLGSENIQRSIKPVLLSVLGDLVFAMGTSYSYKDLTCTMLVEILGLDRNLDILFIDNLKKNGLILLDILLMVFEKEIDKELVINFIERVLNEDERNVSVKQLLDLSCDYVSVYGVDMYSDVFNRVVSKGRQQNIETAEKLYNLIKLE